VPENELLTIKPNTDFGFKPRLNPGLNPGQQIPTKADKTATNIPDKVALENTAERYDPLKRIEADRTGASYTPYKPKYDLIQGKSREAEQINKVKALTDELDWQYDPDRLDREENKKRLYGGLDLGVSFHKKWDYDKNSYTHTIGIDLNKIDLAEQELNKRFKEFETEMRSKFGNDPLMMRRLNEGINSERGFQGLLDTDFSWDVIKDWMHIAGGGAGEGMTFNRDMRKMVDFIHTYLKAKDDLRKVRNLRPLSDRLKEKNGEEYQNYHERPINYDFNDVGTYYMGKAIDGAFGKLANGLSKRFFGETIYNKSDVLSLQENIQNFIESGYYSDKPEIEQNSAEIARYLAERDESTTGLFDTAVMVGGDIAEIVASMRAGPFALGGRLYSSGRNVWNAYKGVERANKINQTTKLINLNKIYAESPEYAKRYNMFKALSGKHNTRGVASGGMLPKVQDLLGNRADYIGNMVVGSFVDQMLSMDENLTAPELAEGMRNMAILAMFNYQYSKAFMYAGQMAGLTKNVMQGTRYGNAVGSKFDALSKAMIAAGQFAAQPGQSLTINNVLEGEDYTAKQMVADVMFGFMMGYNDFLLTSRSYKVFKRANLRDDIIKSNYAEVDYIPYEHIYYTDTHTNELRTRTKPMTEGKEGDLLQIDMSKPEQAAFDQVVQDRIKQAEGTLKKGEMITVKSSNKANMQGVSILKTQSFGRKIDSEVRRKLSIDENIPIKATHLIEAFSDGMNQVRIPKYIQELFKDISDNIDVILTDQLGESTPAAYKDGKFYLNDNLGLVTKTGKIDKEASIAISHEMTHALIDHAIKVNPDFAIAIEEIYQQYFNKVTDFVKKNPEAYSIINEKAGGILNKTFLNIDNDGNPDHYRNMQEMIALMYEASSKAKYFRTLMHNVDPSLKGKFLGKIANAFGLSPEAYKRIDHELTNYKKYINPEAEQTAIDYDTGTENAIPGEMPYADENVVYDEDVDYLDSPETFRPLDMSTESLKTDSFKEWFGDWETDPENASKTTGSSWKKMITDEYQKAKSSGMKYSERQKIFDPQTGVLKLDLNDPYHNRLKYELENDLPITFYHATGVSEDFTQFQPFRKRKTGNWYGIYGSISPKLNESYAGTKRNENNLIDFADKVKDAFTGNWNKKPNLASPSPRQIPLYFNLKNPLILNEHLGGKKLGTTYVQFDYEFHNPVEQARETFIMVRDVLANALGSKSLKKITYSQAKVAVGTIAASLPLLLGEPDVYKSVENLARLGMVSAGFASSGEVASLLASSLYQVKRQIDKVTNPVGKLEKKVAKNPEKYTDISFISEGMYNILKNMGYDGIIFNDGFEILAFDPTQVKSATSNKGTYDSNNPDFLEMATSSLRDDLDEILGGEFDLKKVEFMEEATRILTPQEPGTKREVNNEEKVNYVSLKNKLNLTNEEFVKLLGQDKTTVVERLKQNPELQDPLEINNNARKILHTEPKKSFIIKTRERDYEDDSIVFSGMAEANIDPTGKNILPYRGQPAYLKKGFSRIAADTKIPLLQKIFNSEIMDINGEINTVLTFQFPANKVNPRSFSPTFLHSAIDQGVFILPKTTGQKMMIIPELKDMSRESKNDFVRKANAEIFEKVLDSDYIWNDDYQKREQVMNTVKLLDMDKVIPAVLLDKPIKMREVLKPEYQGMDDKQLEPYIAVNSLIKQKILEFYTDNRKNRQVPDYYQDDAKPSDVYDVLAKHIYMLTDTGGKTYFNKFDKDGKPSLIKGTDKYANILFSEHHNKLIDYDDFKLTAQDEVLEQMEVPEQKERLKNVYGSEIDSNGDVRVRTFNFNQDMVTDLLDAYPELKDSYNRFIQSFDDNVTDGALFCLNQPLYDVLAKSLGITDTKGLAGLKPKGFEYEDNGNIRITKGMLWGPENFKNFGNNEFLSKVIETMQDNNIAILSFPTASKGAHTRRVKFASSPDGKNRYVLNNDNNLIRVEDQTENGWVSNPEATNFEKSNILNNLLNNNAPIPDHFVSKLKITGDDALTFEQYVHKSQVTNTSNGFETLPAFNASSALFNTPEGNAVTRIMRNVIRQNINKYRKIDNALLTIGNLGRRVLATPSKLREDIEFSRKELNSIGIYLKTAKHHFQRMIDNDSGEEAQYLYNMRAEDMVKKIDEMLDDKGKFKPNSLMLLFSLDNVVGGPFLSRGQTVLAKILLFQNLESKIKGRIPTINAKIAPDINMDNVLATTRELLGEAIDAEMNYDPETNSSDYIDEYGKLKEGGAVIGKDIWELENRMREQNNMEPLRIGDKMLFNKTPTDDMTNVLIPTKFAGISPMDGVAIMNGKYVTKYTGGDYDGDGINYVRSDKNFNKADYDRVYDYLDSITELRKSVKDVANEFKELVEKDTKGYLVINKLLGLEPKDNNMSLASEEFGSNMAKHQLGQDKGIVLINNIGHVLNQVALDANNSIASNKVKLSVKLNSRESQEIKVRVNPALDIDKLGMLSFLKQTFVDSYETMPFDREEAVYRTVFNDATVFLPDKTTMSLKDYIKSTGKPAMPILRDIFKKLAEPSLLEARGLWNEQNIADIVDKVLGLDYHDVPNRKDATSYRYTLKDYRRILASDMKESQLMPDVEPVIEPPSKEFLPEVLEQNAIPGEEPGQIPKSVKEVAQSETKQDATPSSLSTKYEWARYAESGYEVSSAGDKRFSALNARLKDGRTIEEAYQLDIKGYRSQGDNWRLGKGKKPLNNITPEDSWSKYKSLWEQFLNENPDLKQDLAQKALGKPLTDKFAETDVSQARALAEILNEQPITSSDQPIQAGPPKVGEMLKEMVSGTKLGAAYGILKGLEGIHAPATKLLVGDNPFELYARLKEKSDIVNTDEYTEQDVVGIVPTDRFEQYEELQNAINSNVLGFTFAVKAPSANKGKNEIYEIIQGMLKEGGYQRYKDTHKWFKPKSKTTTDKAAPEQRVKYVDMGKFDRDPNNRAMGTSADRAMREVADGFIGEVFNEDTKSSTSTSSLHFSNENNISRSTEHLGTEKGMVYFDLPDEAIPGTHTIMLARNSELAKIGLDNSTKKQIKVMHDQGHDFVVGNSWIDQPFHDYLEEIGAKYTVYGHEGKNRIKPKEVKSITEPLTAKPSSEPALKIEEVHRYNPELLRENPDKLYVFGDNLTRKGRGGQAVIRKEPNAVGIVTKLAPSKDAAAYMSDNDLSNNQKIIDADIQNIKSKLSQYPGGLVFPKDGLGTGLAELHWRASETFAYLNRRLAEEFGYKKFNRFPNETTTTKEQAGSFTDAIAKRLADEKAKTASPVLNKPEHVISLGDGIPVMAYLGRENMYENDPAFIDAVRKAFPGIEYANEKSAGRSNSDYIYLNEFAPDKYVMNNRDKHFVVSNQRSWPVLTENGIKYSVIGYEGINWPLRKEHSRNEYSNELTRMIAIQKMHNSIDEVLLGLSKTIKADAQRFPKLKEMFSHFENAKKFNDKVWISSEQTHIAFLVANLAYNGHRSHTSEGNSSPYEVFNTKTNQYEQMEMLYGLTSFKDHLGLPLFKSDKFPNVKIAAGTILKYLIDNNPVKKGEFVVWNKDDAQIIAKDGVLNAYRGGEVKKQINLNEIFDKDGRLVPDWLPSDLLQSKKFRELIDIQNPINKKEFGKVRAKIVKNIAHNMAQEAAQSGLNLDKDILATYIAFHPVKLSKYLAEQIIGGIFNPIFPKHADPKYTLHKKTENYIGKGRAQDYLASNKMDNPWDAISYLKDEGINLKINPQVTLDDHLTKSITSESIGIKGLEMSIESLQDTETSLKHSGYHEFYKSLAKIIEQSPDPELVKLQGKSILDYNYDDMKVLNRKVFLPHLEKILPNLAIKAKMPPEKVSKWAKDNLDKIMDMYGPADLVRELEGDGGYYDKLISPTNDVRQIAKKLAHMSYIMAVADMLKKFETMNTGKDIHNYQILKSRIPTQMINEFSGNKTVYSWNEQILGIPSFNGMGNSVMHYEIMEHNPAINTEVSLPFGTYAKQYPLVRAIQKLTELKAHVDIQNQYVDNQLTASEKLNKNNLALESIENLESVGFNVIEPSSIEGAGNRIKSGQKITDMIDIQTASNRGVKEESVISLKLDKIINFALTSENVNTAVDMLVDAWERNMIESQGSMMNTDGTSTYDPAYYLLKTNKQAFDSDLPLAEQLSAMKANLTEQLKDYINYKEAVLTYKNSLMTYKEALIDFEQRYLRNNEIVEANPNVNILNDLMKIQSYIDRIGNVEAKDLNRLTKTLKEGVSLSEVSTIFDQKYIKPAEETLNSYQNNVKLINEQINNSLKGNAKKGFQIGRNKIRKLIDLLTPEERVELDRNGWSFMIKRFLPEIDAIAEESSSKAEKLDEGFRIVPDLKAKAKFMTLIEHVYNNYYTLNKHPYHDMMVKLGWSEYLEKPWHRIHTANEWKLASKGREMVLRAHESAVTRAAKQESITVFHKKDETKSFESTQAEFKQIMAGSKSKPYWGYTDLLNANFDQTEKATYLSNSIKTFGEDIGERIQGSLYNVSTESMRVYLDNMKDPNPFAHMNTISELSKASNGHYNYRQVIDPAEYRLEFHNAELGNNLFVPKGLSTGDIVLIGLEGGRTIPVRMLGGIKIKNANGVYDAYYAFGNDPTKSKDLSYISADRIKSMHKANGETYLSKAILEGQRKKLNQIINNDQELVNAIKNVVEIKTGEQNVSYESWENTVNPKVVKAIDESLQTSGGRKIVEYMANASDKAAVALYYLRLRHLIDGVFKAGLHVAASNPAGALYSGLSATTKWLQGVFFQIKFQNSMGHYDRIYQNSVPQRKYIKNGVGAIGRGVRALLDPWFQSGDTKNEINERNIANIASHLVAMEHGLTKQTLGQEQINSIIDRAFETEEKANAAIYEMITGKKAPWWKPGATTSLLNKMAKGMQELDPAYGIDNELGEQLRAGTEYNSRAVKRVVDRLEWVKVPITKNVYNSQTKRHDIETQYFHIPRIKGLSDRDNIFVMTLMDQLLDIASLKGRIAANEIGSAKKAVTSSINNMNRYQSQYLSGLGSMTPEFMANKAKIDQYKMIGYYGKNLKQQGLMARQLLRFSNFGFEKGQDRSTYWNIRRDMYNAYRTAIGPKFDTFLNDMAKIGIPIGEWYLADPKADMTRTATAMFTSKALGVLVKYSVNALGATTANAIMSAFEDPEKDLSEIFSMSGFAFGPLEILANTLAGIINLYLMFTAEGKTGKHEAALQSKHARDFMMNPGKGFSGVLGKGATDAINAVTVALFNAWAHLGGFDNMYDRDPWQKLNKYNMKVEENMLNYIYGGLGNAKTAAELYYTK